MQYFPTRRGTLVSDCKISCMLKTAYIERRLKLHKSNRLRPSITLYPTRNMQLCSVCEVGGLGQKKKKDKF